MDAYSPLLHIHSMLRYAVLLLLVIAILKALAGWLGRRPFTKADNTIGTALLAITHTQFLLGLVLYFVSPTVAVALSNMGEAMKEPTLRFWAVEHLTGMLIAVVCITMGRVLSKKATEDIFKHRRAAVWFSVALAIIISMIPWVMRGWLPA